ncbi:hypothetical protein STEG23_030115, partial [Scotinomys teguina]
EKESVHEPLDNIIQTAFFRGTCEVIIDCDSGHPSKDVPSFPVLDGNSYNSVLSQRLEQHEYTQCYQESSQFIQSTCGSLNVIGPNKITENGIIGKCGFVGMGVVLLEEVCHDVTFATTLKQGPLNIKGDYQESQKGPVGEFSGTTPGLVLPSKRMMISMMSIPKSTTRTKQLSSNQVTQSVYDKEEAIIGKNPAISCLLLESCESQALREPQVTILTWPSPEFTQHNQSRKWHRNGIRNLSHKDTNLLRGADLKFLRNIRFAKKYNKKGLKKTQADKAKAVSARAEAIEALVKPKLPKGPNCKLRRLAFIAYPKLGKQIRSYTAKGRRICQPKPKAQTKAKATTPAQAPKGAQAPVMAP